MFIGNNEVRQKINAADPSSIKNAINIVIVIIIGTHLLSFTF